MAVDYAVKYDLQNLVDERFKLEAKSDRAVNQDFDFNGGKSVKVYDISTAPLTDYARTGANRFGEIQDLDATTQELILTQDKAFTFAIDSMDEDETKGALEAGKALERQVREVIIPTIDTYRFGVMASKAGKTKALALTDANIYEAILDATVALDEAEVPAEGRQIIVVPETYKLMKAHLDTELVDRARGLVGTIDGYEVILVPSTRIGVENFGFLVTHPVATTAPVKLAEYRVHANPPGISGDLVEGRVYFDAFVLNNKANAVYLHTLA